MFEVSVSFLLAHSHLLHQRYLTEFVKCCNSSFRCVDCPFEFSSGGIWGHLVYREVSVFFFILIHIKLIMDEEDILNGNRNK